MNDEYCAHLKKKQSLMITSSIKYLHFFLPHQNPATYLNNSKNNSVRVWDKIFRLIIETAI